MMRRAVIVALNALVLLLSCVSLIFTADAMGKIFPGFLVYPNLLVSPLDLPGRLPYRESIAFPWALEAVDSTQIGSINEMEKMVASLHPNEVHMFTFRRGMERMAKGLPLVILDLSDILAVCGPLCASALILLGVGIVAGLMFPETPASWSLFFACLSLGGWLGTTPDWMVSHTIPWAHLFFSSTIPSSILGLILFFPSPAAKSQRYVLHVLLLGLPCIAIFLLFLAFISSPEGYTRVDSLDALLSVFLLIILGVRLAWIVMSSHNRKDREVTRVFLVRGLLPFGLACIPLGLLIYFFHVPYAMFAFSTLLVALPPAAMAWALSKVS